MVDSFVFQRRWWDALKMIAICDSHDALDAMLFYVFEDKEPDEPGAAAAFLELIKPELLND